MNCSHFYSHATLEVKGQNKPEERLIEGYFSTKDTDRSGDIILPTAFTNTVSSFLKNPILCFNHDWSQGIGKVEELSIDENGGKVKARIATGTALSDEVWNLITQGVYNAFSFAFIIKDSTPVNPKEPYSGRIITDLDLLEVSVVTIPANASASFSIAKGLKWGVDVFPVIIPSASQKTGNYVWKSLEGQAEVKEEVKEEVTEEIKEGVTEEIKAESVELTPSAPDKGELEEKGATQFKDLPLLGDDVEWSKVKAKAMLAKWASSDGSGDKDKIDWRKYSQGFFWYDSTNPENFGSYKLPFCYVQDGELYAVPRGIYACAVVINGGRGGVNIPDEDLPSVKNHINKYYKKMGKESPFEKGILYLLDLINNYSNNKYCKSIVEMANLFEKISSELSSYLLGEMDDRDIKLVGNIVTNLMEEKDEREKD